MRKLYLFIISSFVLGGVLSAQSLQSQQGNDGKYGFVDASGAFVIQPEYDDVHFEFYKGAACVKQKDRFLLINEAGKSISKMFDAVDYFDSHDLCQVSIGGKLGIVSTSGELILDTKYAHIGDFDANGLAVINLGGMMDADGTLKGGKYGFIDTTGKVVAEPCYSFIGERDQNGLRWVNIGGMEDESGRCTGGKYGYIDDKATVIVEPMYTFVGAFVDGVCWVCLGGKEFISDKTIDAQVNSYAQREKNPAKVIAKRIELENQITGGKMDILDHKVMGGKYGFINSAGKVIAQPIYTSTANTFTEGCAWVALNGKYGYVRTDGTLIAECIYDQVAPQFSEGTAWAKKSFKKETFFGYLDADGKEITEFKYAKVTNMRNGFAVVCSPAVIEKGTVTQPARYGLIGSKGEPLTDLKYDGINKIGEGMALCKSKNRFCYINATGKEITPFVINAGTVFNDGVAIVKLNPEDAAACKRGEALPAPINAKRNPQGLFGIIDNNGIAVSEFAYTSIAKPSDGMIAVARNGKYGYLNTAGDTVIQEVWDSARDFSYGYAAVCKDGKWGWIDREGITIIAPEYDDAAQERVEELMLVKRGEKWGAISAQGETIVPFELGSAALVKEITQTLYSAGGRVPLSTRTVTIFSTQKLNINKRFTISDTIPNEYWDY